MVTAKLYDVDPALFDGKAPPQSFIDAHLSPDELMDRLGIDDISLFWLAVRDGRIPRGVWLPVNPPMCCWNADVIEEWIRCGCPPDVIHEAHRTLVLNSLVNTIRDTLSAHPPKASERN